MDHHEAYRLIQELLDELGRRPYSDLESRVGMATTEQVATASGASIVLEWRVDRSTGEPPRLVVTATADSPDWFRVDRLEERIFVREP
ncbi:MAG: hypothetical protein R3F34_05665 [Planctomycetota bacterium]